MRILLALIAITFVLGACDPQDTYRECREVGDFSDARCGFNAFGGMFVHPDWY